MNLIKRFNELYDNSFVSLRQRSLYMMITSLIYFVLSIVLIFIDAGNRNNILFFIKMSSMLLLVFFFIFIGKSFISQIVIWLTSFSELFFLININTPEVIVLTEIMAIALALLFIIHTNFEKVLIFLTVVFLSVFRISLNINNNIQDTIISYSLIISILIGMLILNKILQAGLESQEKLIEEKHNVIKAYEKMYHLKDTLRYQNQKIEHIKDLLYIDELTGMLNRKAFSKFSENKLKTAERNNKILTITYIDLDHLKYVNDYLGHSSGDDYLHMFADVVTQCIRSEDMAFRIGGDEFILLFYDCSEEKSDAVVERIKTIFKINSGKSSLNLPGSFSYGSVDSKGYTSDDLEHILEASDVKMREYKKNKGSKRGE